MRASVLSAFVLLTVIGCQAREQASPPGRNYSFEANDEASLILDQAIQAHGGQEKDREERTN